MRRWPSLTAMLVTAALAAAPSQAAGQSSSARADAWTTRIALSLSASEVGLPVGATARHLAQAALERRAERLGLSRELEGVRLGDRLRVRGANGARALMLLRFHQTAGGRRVLWSQIDVDVAGREVSSIGATVVPAKSDRLSGERRVTRARALRIAHHAVRGPEETGRPVLLAYAGKPAVKDTPLRTARLAWVVQTTPEGERGDDAPTGWCIVVDAETGKILARWRGTVAGSDRPSGDRPGARAAQARLLSSVELLRVFDTDISPNASYARWKTSGSPFVFHEWPSPYSDAPEYFVPASQRTADMDAVTRNALHVAQWACLRGFCGRFGGFENPVTGDDALKGDDRVYYTWYLYGNTGYSLALMGNVYISRTDGHAHDAIAHELGHIMDLVYADDRRVTPQGREVQEALADMFAFDFDSDDPTIGENSDSGPYRNLANPGALPSARGRYPASMREYLCPPSSSAPHHNSTILSHAFYLFAQEVGSLKAGHVLQYIPWFLDPEPRFIDVKAGFNTRSAQLYPFDDPNDPDRSPEVAEASGRAFVDAIDMRFDPPGC